MGNVKQHASSCCTAALITTDEGVADHGMQFMVV